MPSSKTLLLFGLGLLTLCQFGAQTVEVAEGVTDGVLVGQPEE